MRYRKKPVVIDAVRWTGSNADELTLFMADAEWSRPLFGDYLTILTREGEMRADRGDWVIKGVKGEFYPCKPDIFDATYESAGPT